MCPKTIMLDATLARLPPPWPVDVLPAIREELRRSRRKVVVFDDDPTGTQTVHGVAVLTEWSVDALAREFAASNPVFYVLTNSRSLVPAAADALMREIAANLHRAAARVGCSFSVVNRGDSTLRGHFPTELDALAESLELRAAPWLIIPFFEAGGRLTIGDVHYVADGELLVPAGETAFAKDATFGFRSSNMREWVEEKTATSIPAASVASISLEQLRVGGPDAVQRQLVALPPASVCIVNSAAGRDIEVFVLGLLRAEAEGKQFLYRTAASFVAARMGLAPQPLLRDFVSGAVDATGGLVVVGSHVPRTTEQLLPVLACPGFARVELVVGELWSPVTRANEIAHARDFVAAALTAGQTCVLYTSRRLTTGADPVHNLRLAMSVSDALTEVVAGLDVRPRFLIVKGGITASEVATKALRVRRAVVVGQLLPGVPVWRLGDESRWPNLPYVVFPGNVGRHDALLVALAKLSPVSTTVLASAAK